MLIFGCRYILRQYEQSGLEKSFSVCDLEDTVYGVPSQQKSDIEDLPGSTARTTKVKRQPPEDDFKDTTLTCSKGEVVIFEAMNLYSQMAFFTTVFSIFGGILPWAKLCCS